MKQYTVKRDCWFDNRLWKQGETAYFSDEEKIPEHFEFVQIIGRPKKNNASRVSKKNEDKD